MTTKTYYNMYYTILQYDIIYYTYTLVYYNIIYYDINQLRKLHVDLVKKLVTVAEKRASHGDYLIYDNILLYTTIYSNIIDGNMYNLLLDLGSRSQRQTHSESG